MKRSRKTGVRSAYEAQVRSRSLRRGAKNAEDVEGRRKIRQLAARFELEVRRSGAERNTQLNSGRFLASLAHAFVTHLRLQFPRYACERGRGRG